MQIARVKGIENAAITAVRHGHFVAHRPVACQAPLIETGLFTCQLFWIVHRLPNVATALDVQPEVRACTKHTGEYQSSSCGDVAAIVTQFVDVLTLYAHSLG